jgi:hypothetical protein
VLVALDHARHFVRRPRFREDFQNLLSVLAHGVSLCLIWVSAAGDR